MKLIKANFILSIIFLITFLIFYISDEIYYESAIGSALETISLILSDITSLVLGIVIMAILTLNTILYINSKKEKGDI